MTFENTVARFRKCCEHRDELLSIVEGLKGEIEALEADIIDACMADPSLFNVYTRKNKSEGRVGRNYFSITFAKTLMRRGATDRLDDQDWLEGLDQQYVRTKYQLSASKIKADHSAGVITDAALQAMDLKYGDSLKVNVSYVPDDKTIAGKAEEARALLNEE